ncbi:YisL family protein [Thalassobacillus sp. B23F22_16]|uniref:YisL family protein n=1 Tax=Thalassobacillus sp. B23F22_16 TaxID=3459513 RepID=UPI00373E362D
MAHLHITAWVIALALLMLVLTFSRAGNAKAAKITQMVMRLFYLVILYSGGSLFASYANIGVLVIVKMLVGLWVIAAIEMVAIKVSKGQPASSWWIQLVVSFVLALILGFGFMPLGILPA